MGFGVWGRVADGDSWETHSWVDWADGVVTGEPRRVERVASRTVTRGRGSRGRVHPESAKGREAGIWSRLWTREGWWAGAVGDVTRGALPARGNQMARDANRAGTRVSSTNGVSTLLVCLATSRVLSRKGCTSPPCSRREVQNESPEGPRDGSTPRSDSWAAPVSCRRQPELEALLCPCAGRVGRCSRCFV